MKIQDTLLYVWMEKLIVFPQKKVFFSFLITNKMSFANKKCFIKLFCENWMEIVNFVEAKNMWIFHCKWNLMNHIIRPRPVIISPCKMKPLSDLPLELCYLSFIGNSWSSFSSVLRREMNFRISILYKSNFNETKKWTKKKRQTYYSIFVNANDLS